MVKCFLLFIASVVLRKFITDSLPNLHYKKVWGYFVNAIYYMIIFTSLVFVFLKLKLHSLGIIKQSTEAINRLTILFGIILFGIVLIKMLPKFQLKEIKTIN